MDRSDASCAGALFREMHRGPAVLVLANPWDVGTARLLANAGFRALHTTSAGLAFTMGRRDGDGAVSADETFRHVWEIVQATPLPVTADLENGFGDSPEAVARTIRRAGDAGLAGGSIEDATFRVDAPIYERSLAVERIAAAVEAARSLARPFVVTARADGFIRGQPDLDDVLRRLQAFEVAGADVLYAPGLPDEGALRLVCKSVKHPVNQVIGVGGTAHLSLAQLQEIGVRRVSLGTSLVRCALAAALASAREILDQGTFDFARGLPTVGAFNELIAPLPSAG